MAVEFYIHKMSEHMDEAEIIRWLVAEGDAVQEHQPIVEVMTDKFTVEIEAPVAGVLAGVRPGCGKGAIVPVGQPLAHIVQPGEQAPVLPAFGTPAASAATPLLPRQETATTGTVDPIGRVRSTPVARRMASDLGVDIERLTGTGPGGRVTEADVQAAVQARDEARSAVPSAPVASPSLPAPAPAAKAPESAPPISPGAATWLDLTPIQRVTGERMHASVVNAPQFALELAADATNLQWLRTALDDRITLEARARLSLTSMLVKIVAAALRAHPRANAEFDGGRVKLHQAINIGVAVGTEQGLVVPVIKDAGQKSLAAVAAELATFQVKAQSLHFSAEDLSGGTFTLSNLGMYGIERFTAILNPPQSAILAVGAVAQIPAVLANGTVGIQPRMNLTLTVDHRVMDGLQGARFLGEIKEKVERPYFLI